MIPVLIAFVIGSLIGIGIMCLVGINRSREDEQILKKKDERIENQTKTIFEFRAEAVKYKGMAASEETRADLLQKMKDELQSDYDQLASDYKEVVLDYKKLYLELDAIKTAEVRKFRTPEEIEALLKMDNDFNEVIKELSTIEEMLLEVKPKVLLAG